MKTKKITMYLSVLLCTLILTIVDLCAQTGLRAVTGIVTEGNQPAIGVNVTIKGLAQGVMTNEEGKYKIDVAGQDAVLIFSYIGFTTQEITVGNKIVIDVDLREDTQLLDEVIVVGYGTQKKENLTGAISTVDTKVFRTRPVTSVANALQGSTAGVNIAPPSGNPNSEIEFNIRGTTSINGGSPLVLVDGVEMDMRLVNPNDIESISVLKDASASSIYGVRAAFGVILINTKGGATKEGFTASYNGNFSWSKPTYLPKLNMDAMAYANFLNDAMVREGKNPKFDEPYMKGLEAYYNDPVNNPSFEIVNGKVQDYQMHDWADLMLRNYNPKQSHNVSISGGTDKTNYYASYGHVKQEGIFKVGNDIYTRNNARLTINHNATKWMKVGLKTIYNNSKMNEPHVPKDNFFHKIIFSRPLGLINWEKDSRYPQYDQYDGMPFFDPNPLIYMDGGGRNKLKTQEILLIPSITISPLKGWNIHSDFTFSRTSNDNRYHRKTVMGLSEDMQVGPGFSADDSYQVTKADKDYYSFNLFSDYEITFAEKHYVKVMAGFNQETTKYNTSTAKRYAMISQDKPGLNLGSGAQESGGDTWDYVLRGGFGRINYIYDNKYLAEFSGRYDGTSRFPSNDRFTFLPSFSLAWRISEESFMEFSRKYVDNLKLRGSYGKLGNQFLGSSSWLNNAKYYPYIPIMNAGSTNKYPMNGSLTELTINPAGLISPSLTWEKTATLNGGIDLDMFDSKFNLVFEVFQRKTSDMLIMQTAPELLGTSAPAMNAGELKTKGWELSLGWRDNLGKDFSYSINVAISDASATITKWDGPTNTVDDYYKGKKVGEIWGFVTEGIFQTDEEAAAHPKPTWNQNWTAGDIKYANLDGDNVISRGNNRPDDHGDLRVIGNTTPRYAYSFTLGAEYKGIFMNAFFQGIGKRQFWPSHESFWPVTTDIYNVQSWHINESWTPENKNTYFPIARERQSKNFQTQSRFLQDASYLRLKNLTIGYNVPTQWASRLFLRDARIYFSGENLFTHRNTKGPLDPEAGGGNGGMIYPFQKSLSIGIDLTF